MPENLTDDGWVTLQVPVPPELVAIGVAPDLQRFMDAMIYKLRRNASKGRWETLALADALDAVDSEFQELVAAVQYGSTSEILMEAADVANQALIVAAVALEAKDSAARPAYGRSPALNRLKDFEREQQARDDIIRRSADLASGESPEIRGLHRRNRVR